ncbi:MAG: hypothetical protein AB2693_15735, partial [Candidatus Thiodiazotropha sp.]
GQLETDPKQRKNDPGDSNKQLETLKNSINSLSDQVKNLRRQNQNQGDNKFVNGNQQNNKNVVGNGRYNRQYQNNRPLSYGSRQRSFDTYRGNNPQQNRNHNSYQNQSAQNLRTGANEFVPRHGQGNARQSFNNNNRGRSAQSQNNQGNWNQSVWGATTRRH